MNQSLISPDVAEVNYGERGIWIFVGIDIAIFLLFFLVFLVERRADPALFTASQLRLNEHIGFANTLILITSSWLLVCAIERMQHHARRARQLLRLSMAFGWLFVVVKLYEYTDKFAAGISIVENTFFNFYFILTFIHFCHVIGGLIALAMISGWLGQGARDPREVVSAAKSAGIYWHMVDFLWVQLFLLLYLLR